MQSGKQQHYYKQAKLVNWIIILEYYDH